MDIQELIKEQEERMNQLNQEKEDELTILKLMYDANQLEINLKFKRLIHEETQDYKSIMSEKYWHDRNYNTDKKVN